MAYYRAYGVGTPSDVATHVGTSAPHVRSELPDDLERIVNKSHLLVYGKVKLVICSWHPNG